MLKKLNVILFLLCALLACRGDDDVDKTKNDKNMDKYFRDMTPDEIRRSHLGQDLFQAVGKDQLEEVERLAKEGANVNIRIPQPPMGYFTPLYIATYRNNAAMVKVLLEYGAEPDLITPEGTCLMIAAAKGNLEIVQILLEYGSDINGKNDYGTTALMAAVNNNRIDIIKYLLQKGAYFSLKNKSNKTALMYAKEKGNPEIIKLLEEAGAKE